MRWADTGENALEMFADEALNRGRVQRLRSAVCPGTLGGGARQGPVAVVVGKERPGAAPIEAQRCQQPGRQERVAILAALFLGGP